jgi:hypothetical protein
MSLKNNQEILLALIKTGLWETEGQFSSTEGVDWDEVYRLASEQSVLGVVLAGIEHLIVKPPQELLLQMIGEVQMIEQTNKAMNQFIEKLVGGMRKADIYTLLVKGQGIAQCYERPLWRQSGDVDLLLSEDNYQKAKHYLLPLCTDQKNEERYSQHLGLNIDQWYVEIHGSLRTGLSGRVDKEVDANQRNVFYDGQVRSWNNGNTQVFLPAPDNDVFFVFTHFIKHFYKEGMGLRQVCDWCRLMWTYKDTLNHELLEKRIKRAGLMSEWKAFAALAIEYLGMPVEAMPLYDVTGKKDEVRGKKLIAFILAGYSGNKMKDTMQIAKIFPWKTLWYSPSIFLNVNWLKVRERLFN